MSARIREAAGLILGAFTAPFFAVVSFLRHARTFHPDGVVYVADGHRHVDVADENAAIADRLIGSAMVRFSGALWRRGFEHFDVLGIALRFRRTDDPTVRPADSDQDLLFATIRSPFTMPISPLTTRPGDYLGNTYYAVSPFVDESGRKVKFRIVPECAESDASASRNDRLKQAFDRAPVRLRLDVRKTFARAWKPLAVIALKTEIAVDQQALRFSPFQTGRGLRPRGLVHALRRAAYPASQWGRQKAKLST